MKDPTTEVRVAVVISTANRSEKLVVSIESILKNNYPNFDLYIIDQGAGEGASDKISSFLENPNFHYFQGIRKGGSAGKNEGIARARSAEFIAVTDDDCIVPENWIEEIANAFDMDENIGVVFGSVIPIDHDSTQGFVPSYLVEKEFTARSIKDKNKLSAIGACMAFRRSVWEKVGKFDEMLGPGSPMNCGNEEGDFVVKALLAGYFAMETPRLSVIHDGYRTHAQGKNLAWRNWFGIGAGYTKHLKLSNWSILPILWHEFWWGAVKQLIDNTRTHRKISGVTPILAFLNGFIWALRTPINNGTSNFVPQVD